MLLTPKINYPKMDYFYHRLRISSYRSQLLSKGQGSLLLAEGGRVKKKERSAVRFGRDDVAFFFLTWFRR